MVLQTCRFTHERFIWELLFLRIHHTTGVHMHSCCKQLVKGCPNRLIEPPRLYVPVCACVCGLACASMYPSLRNTCIAPLSSVPSPCGYIKHAAQMCCHASSCWRDLWFGWVRKWERELEVSRGRGREGVWSCMEGRWVRNWGRILVGSEKKARFMWVGKKFERWLRGVVVWILHPVSPAARLTSTCWYACYQPDLCTFWHPYFSIHFL